MDTIANAAVLVLPEPRRDGRLSVERALATRRSVREYAGTMTTAELAQVLWACQGITSPEGFRTTPSAGAVYPMQVFAVCERVDGVTPGAYRYEPAPIGQPHRLVAIRPGAFGTTLHRLSTRQDFIAEAPLNVVLAAHPAGMAEKYGAALADRFIYMEMGHAAQNVHLQAEALGLRSVAVGAMDEKALATLLETDATPAYMISVGRQRTGG